MTNTFFVNTFCSSLTLNEDAETRSTWLSMEIMGLMLGKFVDDYTVRAMQMPAAMPVEAPVAPSNPAHHHHHHNPFTQLLGKHKNKAKTVSSKANPLLAHLQPSNNQAIIGGATSSNQPTSKLTEIQTTLNTSYAAYTELKRKNSMALAAPPPATTTQ